MRRHPSSPSALSNITCVSDGPQPSTEPDALSHSLTLCLLFCICAGNHWPLSLSGRRSRTAPAALLAHLINLTLPLDKRSGGQMHKQIARRSVLPRWLERCRANGFWRHAGQEEREERVSCSVCTDDCRRSVANAEDFLGFRQISPNF